jgi:competence protein ComFB
MKIYNYMEDTVRDTLDSLLSKRKDICKCQKCKLDMMTWALNRLPPKYIVTDKGRMYTKLKEQEIQSRADVVREVTRAISYISSKPQH